MDEPVDLPRGADVRDALGGRARSPCEPARSIGAGVSGEGAARERAPLEPYVLRRAWMGVGLTRTRRALQEP